MYFCCKQCSCHIDIDTQEDLDELAIDGIHCPNCNVIHWITLVKPYSNAVSLGNNNKMKNAVINITGDTCGRDMVKITIKDR